MPAQDDLGGGAVQAGGDGLDGGGGEALAASQRCPALGDDAARCVGGSEVGLLELGVKLDLVEDGGDAGLSCEAVEFGGVEVGGADGGDCAVVSQFDQGAPGIDVLVAGGAGPVDEAEIEAVQVQAFQAFGDGLQGGFVSLAVVPDFCGDENLVTRDAGGGDAFAHANLIAVNRGTVDEAVAHLQRVSGGAGGVSDLPEAETELRDGMGVVEGEGMHLGLSGGIGCH